MQANGTVSRSGGVFHDGVQQGEREKYPDLPELNEIDYEWDILDSVGREGVFPKRVVRYTRWFIIRAINSWAGYLHEFILPNQQNAVSMEEFNYFTDEQKQEVVGILNWIMYRLRCVNAVQLAEDDDASAKLTAQMYTEWKEKKQLLRKVVDLNAQVWKKKVNGG